MENPEPDYIEEPISYLRCLNTATGRLNISCRDLARWPFSAPPPGRVASLDAIGNRFTQIPDAVLRLHGLRHLRLRDNRIVKIPDAIAELARLESLDLGENPVRHVSDHLCRLEGLRGLVIYGGCLESVPAAIGRLACLRQLILGNELPEVPSGLGMCRQLRRLSLSSNRLHSLPPGLGQLENLVELRVDNNLLQTWPSTFRGLRSLRWLHAEGNPLRQLPWFVLELPAIRGLSCCNFLVTPAEAGRFTRACVGRGIFLLWNRSLYGSETYDPDLGDDADDAD